MKKYRILFLLLLCLFLQLASSAEVLKGGVEKVWTVGTARTETFKDLKPVLDLSWAPPTDPNFKEDIQAVNNHQGEIGNRLITNFSNGYYSVWVLDEDNYDKTYYYSISGELVAIEFLFFPRNISDLQSFVEAEQNNQLYPTKRYKHAYPSGKIVRMVLTASEKDTYWFNPSGDLAYHWIGSNCYDANGRKTITRQDPSD